MQTTLYNKRSVTRKAIRVGGIINNTSHMKKTLLVSTVLAIAALFVCCSTDNDDNVKTTEEAAKSKAMPERISNALSEIIENKNGEYADGGFIVYDPSIDELVACNEMLYGAVSGFMEGRAGKGVANNGANKAPSGSGWISAGTCEGLAGTVKPGKNISTKIPEGEKFEIHVEPQDDGTYKVWYRVVK